MATIQNALFHATTDPPQVTVKLWLPPPPSSPLRTVIVKTKERQKKFNESEKGKEHIEGAYASRMCMLLECLGAFVGRKRKNILVEEKEATKEGSPGTSVY